MDIRSRGREPRTTRWTESVKEYNTEQQRLHFILISSNAEKKKKTREEFRVGALRRVREGANQSTRVYRSAYLYRVLDWNSQLDWLCTYIAL